MMICPCLCDSIFVHRLQYRIVELSAFFSVSSCVPSKVEVDVGPPFGKTTAKSHPEPRRKQKTAGLFTRNICRLAWLSCAGEVDISSC